MILDHHLDFTVVLVSWCKRAHESHACCSTRQDDIIVVHVTNDYSSVIESPFKTEFLMTLVKRYRNLTNKNLVLEFNDVYVSTHPFTIFFAKSFLLFWTHGLLDCLGLSVFKLVDVLFFLYFCIIKFLCDVR